MDVDQTLSGLEKIRDRFRKKPIGTSIWCAVIILFFIGFSFFGYGYFAEKGRQFASDESHAPSSSPYTTPKLVTISKGEIKLSGPGLYLVDTENRVGSDDITKISGLSRGDKVILKAADDDRTIVVREGDFLITQAPVFYLNNKNDKIIFVSEGADVCAEDDRISLGN